MLQPFEEAAFVIFTRSVSSKTSSSKEKDVFDALLRVAIIFGSMAVSYAINSTPCAWLSIVSAVFIFLHPKATMGPHYSWLALRCVDFGLVLFVIYFDTQSFVRREVGERALRG